MEALRRSGRSTRRHPEELIGKHPSGNWRREGSRVPGHAMASAMLRVLGTFDASADGAPLRRGGTIQRGVLARIVIAGTVPVSAERIVEDVWGERAGPEAVH